ncbi:hypothetical protein HK405_006716, partial [Cladochytrium tenue]
SGVPYHSDSEAYSHHHGHDYPHSKKPTADGADRTSLLGPASLRVPDFGLSSGGNGGRTHGMTSVGHSGDRHAVGGGVAGPVDRDGKPGPSSTTAGQGRQRSTSPLLRWFGGRRGEEGHSDDRGRHHHRHGLPSDHVGRLSHQLSELQMSSPVGGGHKGGHKHECEAEHLNIMLMNSVTRLYQVSAAAKEKAAKAVAAASGAANNAAADKANNDAATYSALKELRSARLLEVEWAAMAGRAVATSVLDGLVSLVLLQHSVRDAARRYQHDGDWVLMVLEMFANHVASAVGRPEFAVDKILRLTAEEVERMKNEKKSIEIEVDEDDDTDDDTDDDKDDDKDDNDDDDDDEGRI